jgi:glycogen debranching enzyme
MEQAEKKQNDLWELGLSVIKELETEHGILASSKTEIFGCIFGRDSLITSLKLLSTYEKTGDVFFLNLVRKILLNLVKLQGKEVNIESGEEPGKCIHEFRRDGHEHLTKKRNEPWYVYQDGSMRNYDTVDATPLLLIAIQKYFSISNDSGFLEEVMPGVKNALNWIFYFGDTNNDGFTDYKFHPERKHGGLKTQNWMDSADSIFHEDGSPVVYPVAPIEVQAYTYIALRVWADHFRQTDKKLKQRLSKKADDLKKLFNQKFIIKEKSGFSLAFAIDANGKRMEARRSSMGHCLWSVWKNPKGQMDGILHKAYIPKLVRSLLGSDLFEPEAGIRTLGMSSSRFDPMSYHNGSIWPHDTAMIIEGLENFGYAEEAARVRRALGKAFRHFKTPIELFSYTEGEYKEYSNACKKQAWSAASMLDNSLEDPELVLETKPAVNSSSENLLG